ncbi:hypothetical protein JF550_03755 [Microbacterium esteraromaticum]|uniref:Uncharacterized protein n=1 Tax=Microbacterium esteraromaticum TaxID=57043 RepID=A0A939IU58_9MICO|nr:hypothetical protein [Microbacterium esteraromaticum]MBN8205071.1 hypothetical protein [Microbacterium esteraromaticum]MBN8415225.1 hypothetical protein [Microbacterium esteraromaticum]MBY6060024.1 hypothetical protein [Microbacterium esteraromaticum]
MSDLRNELLGSRTPTLPPYRMLVPPGWEVFELGEQDETQLIGRAAARLKANNRGDLTAAVGRYVRDALTDLRRQNAFAYAIPGEEAPTWVLGSASLVGIRRVSTPDLTLDDVVRNAVAQHGGAPLGEDARIMSWAESRTVTMDGETVRSLMLNYLIPIPGTRRTQAVHWVVNAAHAEDMPDDDPKLEAWKLLFDVHVATFAWLAE